MTTIAIIATIVANDVAMNIPNLILKDEKETLLKVEFLFYTNKRKLSLRVTLLMLFQCILRAAV